MSICMPTLGKTMGQFIFPDSLKGSLDSLLHLGNMPSPRPMLTSDNESNVKNLYIIGDLAGAPVIKLAMEHGFNIVQHILSKPDAESNDPDKFDVLIIGAGTSGLNAALEAEQNGLSYLLLGKGKMANTIENFPEKKWVYAEPDTKPAKGKLWLDGAQKEDLIKRWQHIVEDNKLNILTEVDVSGIVKESSGDFKVATDKETYTAKRVILAIGQRGNPRKLNVPGEDEEQVYHRLYSPRHYKDENILVVGGGNSAIEAALVLSEQNKAVLSYRRDRFSRIFKDNERKLNEAIERGRIQPIMNSGVTEFKDHVYKLKVKTDDGKEEIKEHNYDHAFVLVGAELPIKFLKSAGIKMENEWQGNLWTAVATTIIFFILLSFFGPDDRMKSIAVLPKWLAGVASLGALGALITMGKQGNRYA